MPVPYLRHKLYSREAVERFLKGQARASPAPNYVRRRQRAAEDKEAR